MKINPSYRQENADDKKSDRADWVAQARRHSVKNEESAAAKNRSAESSFKEESKFSGILESATTAQKLKPMSDEAGEQRRDDEKKEKKNVERDKDSADNAAVDYRIERNGAQFGGNFSGNGGFGGDINQTVHLNENFAARSILHIADLERMISAVRKLTKLDGKREITVELKRSVMEGLKVKITTGDAAQIQIEFLAANEKVRSQIENHAEELANILRGRGVNLQSLRATIASEAKTFRSESKNFAVSNQPEIENENAESTNGNTFD